MAQRQRIYLKRLRFNPWVGKITWRRAWQPIPVFLPGESYGQGSLAIYCLCGHKEWNPTEVTEHAHTQYAQNWCAFWFMDLPLFPCNKIIFNAIISIKCSLHPYPKGLITTCLVIPIWLYSCFCYHMAIVFFLIDCEPQQGKDCVLFHFVIFRRISSVQSLSHVRLFATPWIAACQASLSITNSWSLLKFMSITSVMPSNNLILCHPFHLPPSVSPKIRFFSKESVLRIRWPKYWSFSFSISPSNEYSGLISLRLTGWIFLQPKSLLQHPSSQASILRPSSLKFLYSPTLISIHDY